MNSYIIIIPINCLIVIIIIIFLFGFRLHFVGQHFQQFLPLLDLGIESALQIFLFVVQSVHISGRLVKDHNPRRPLLCGLEFGDLVLQIHECVPQMVSSFAFRVVVFASPKWRYFRRLVAHIRVQVLVVRLTQPLGWSLAFEERMVLSEHYFAFRRDGRRLPSGGKLAVLLLRRVITTTLGFQTTLRRLEKMLIISNDPNGGNG